MGCGCKGGAPNGTEKKSIEQQFGSSLFIRIIIFILSLGVIGLLLIPIIIPMMILMLFNRIVLERDMDFTGALIKIGKFLRTSKKRVDDDDDDDYDDINDEDINPDDYELMDVDVIK